MFFVRVCVHFMYHYYTNPPQNNIQTACLCDRKGRRNDFGEDESLRYLTIRLLTGSRHSNNNSSSSIRERLLHIEITDEQEPYFLYTLDVGEDDFHELKKDQVSPSIL